MTRNKNSRRFRAIGKDFYSKKKNKENHVVNLEIASFTVTCNKVARSLIECAGGFRKRSGRWNFHYYTFKYPPTMYIVAISVRVDDNYFTSGEIREVYFARVWSVPMLPLPGVLAGCSLCVFPWGYELQWHSNVPLASPRIKKTTLAQLNQLALILYNVCFQEIDEVVKLLNEVQNINLNFYLF